VSSAAEPAPTVSDTTIDPLPDPAVEPSAVHSAEPATEQVTEPDVISGAAGAVAGEEPAEGAPGGSGGPQGRRVIVRGGLWSAASQLLPAAGVALLSVFAAHILGVNALGRQSLIAYVNASTSTVVVAGFDGAVLQAMGRLYGSGDTRLAALQAWMLRVHVLLAVVLAATMTGIGLLLGQDRLAWFVVGLVVLVDTAISGLGLGVAVRQGWAEFGRLNLVAQLFGAPLGIGALTLGLGIPGMFGGDGIAALGLLVAMIVRFGYLYRRPAGRPRIPLRLRPPVPMGRQWGLFSVSNLITQVVGRRVEFIALAIFSTGTQIAFYSVAFTLVSLAAAVPSAVAMAALPVIAAAEGRGDRALATRHMRSAVQVGTSLSIPLVAFAAGLGPVLVELVYGHRYAAAAALVPLSSVVLLTAVTSGVIGQYWSGLGRVGLTLSTGGIAGVADLGLAFALTPSLGATGAIIANLVGQVVYTAGLVLVTRRRIGALRWNLRGLAGMTMASTAAGVGAWLVSRLVTDQLAGPHLLVGLAAVAAGGAVGLPLLVVLALWVKVLSAVELAWLRPLLPSRALPLLEAVTLPPAAPRLPAVP
jgi:O-antigen/teichoic acid export membrane protein